MGNVSAVVSGAEHCWNEYAVFDMSVQAGASRTLTLAATDDLGWS